MNAIITEFTEQDLRNSTAPCPETPAELADYIQSLLDIKHDYGTCVYAMSLAATATFNYAAAKLGVTGFQASCADIDIIRRTRQLDCPFIILTANDMLYPHTNPAQKLADAMEEWRGWAAEQAAEKLKDSKHAHHTVIKHWKNLAKNNK